MNPVPSVDNATPADWWRTAPTQPNDSASHAAIQQPPAMLAKETIRRLARDKLPPTPENFSRVYYEIGGRALVEKKETTNVDAAHAAKAALSLCAALPFSDGARQSIDQAIRRGAWHAIDQILAEAQSMPSKRVGPAIGEVLDELCGAWAETSVLALTSSSPLYRKTPDLKRTAANLMHALRHVRSCEEHGELHEQLKDFSGNVIALQSQEDRTNLQLKSLLSAIVKNVANLNAEHSWLNGQMTRIDAALTSNADEATLRNIESTLRDAGRRQADLKEHLDEAKLALRDMIRVFMERLNSMAASTGEFNNRIDHYAIAIESAEDISSVADVVQHLLNDTRSVHEEMSAAQKELASAQKTAAEYEARSAELERALAKVSEEVRTDNLTQALNRNGFESAFYAEAHKALNDGSSLCLALLDIDNFKSINERHGHDAGDDALVHLSKVIREALRPTDILARLAGEEFVVLMPDTPLDIAVGMAEKLQRQLTRQFFLHGLEKLLVTFSAGVTRLSGDEQHQAVIDRAEQALSHAKRLGKNRVCAS
ncbi:MAG: diguanylate cyclase [Rhodocyclaceae bacterium]|jgi:diguanylate cyclase|nr:diguanylate cyclase [Rhodocyclaceae bacterium]MCE2725047.1 diguanylate cyclase [Betaproteobacteria bacterium]MCA3023597.1 diguanylate cyclase [Rhodocyclaceae bacterium]MCA3024801.1 diguanylate cyclase [Rhodocyclaceae bacterium]MCA3027110.1 diguanylate cyclase [Rhodocyclaceae bacterium]